MDVAGSLRMLGKDVELTEVPAPSLNRTYALSNAKLTKRVGYIPRHSVLDGIQHMLAHLPLDDPSALSDPRYYNLRWLQLLEEASVGGDGKSG